MSLIFVLVHAFRLDTPENWSPPRRSWGRCMGGGVILLIGRVPHRVVAGRPMV